MIIAQISDLHIKPPGKLAYGHVDTARYLQQCVHRLNRLTPQPDVVIATGDLVDGGQPEEYEHLRAILAKLAMPVYVVPGNHDDRSAMRKAFAPDKYLPDAVHLNYTVDNYDVRLIGLDSTIPGFDGGEMSDESLRWLDARLSEQRAVPAIVFMHHPPFRTGITGMDIPFRNLEKFATVIKRHPQVERVVCGHVHRAIQVRWSGTVASTAPSTAHQLLLDLRPNEPVQFIMEPSAFSLHLWDEADGIVSHNVLVNRFDGPYPFRENGRLID